MATTDTALSFDDSAAYERFVGSWGRAAGAIFLDWLAPSTGAHWLDPAIADRARLAVERMVNLKQ